MKKSRMRFSNLQIVSLGYICVILLGTLLLLLPCATANGQSTNILDALFTAVSASCVTGLVVVDTATHWTLFGQLVILLLIQIGGLGFMTISLSLLLLMRKRIGLRYREVMVESINSTQIGGIIRLTRKILIGTLFFEGLGAMVLSLRFIPQFGVIQGMYFGIFHAVSAFCNAGFDLMGNYASIVAYSADPLVNLTLIGLITIGGLGFLVWEDVWINRKKLHHLRLQSKIVLSSSVILTVCGAMLFLVLERNSASLGTGTERIWTAVFQSCTVRTAGFNSIDPAALTGGSKLLMMLLMFIGGSPGSTAGGIKTTTIVVILMYTLAGIRHERSANIFGRSLEEQALHKAISVFFVNLLLVIFGSLAICAVQKDLPLSDIVFEAFSAMGTVGITTGITRELTVFAQCVLIFLMYCGRVGSITFAIALLERKATPPVTLPTERLTIG